MWTVEASMYLETTPEETLAKLTPRSVIEYIGIYDVTGVTQTDSGWTVTALVEDSDLETVFFIEQIPKGFAYELVDGGPFEELTTTITVDDAPLGETDRLDGGEPGNFEVDTDDVVRVTIVSDYTFGGPLSPIYDWLSASSRKDSP